MDENQFEGAARNLGGKVEGAVGNLIGDTKMQAEGAYDKAVGSAQNTYGKAADAVKDGVDAVRSKARQVKDNIKDHGGSQVLDQIEEAGDYLAEQVDNRPVTALLIAAGIGFLIALASKPGTTYYRR